MNLVTNRSLSLAIILMLGLLAGACSSSEGGSVTIYSGRSSSLIQPLLEQFAKDTGTEIKVRYGSTAGTVALLLEEGNASPADVVLLQDAGALGALAKEGMLTELPETLLGRVDSRFRSPAGEWVGVSGRARTVVYNTDAIDSDLHLPMSILDYTDPKWEGRIGWAPTNGSFQAFVTALRVLEGDAAAKAWLEGIKANKPIEFPNNTSIVNAVGQGEIHVGFVNHYYLYRFLAEQGEEFSARNHFSSGDAGALINVSGAGVLATSESNETAQGLIEYLLSKDAQKYFAEETNEYPLIDGIDSVGDMPALDTLNPPDLDLGNLDDLRGTLDLMREAGVVP